ncbi:hypothetical protein [Pseudomonas sp. ML96]|uniref:hypothetical protein n=1 Tax=Pseudomonas sp. ML96 TaxID=1523503 RepID=UPI0005BC341C|nr:hypothetical protein [Pseudomonas sp. ML96]
MEFWKPSIRKLATTAILVAVYFVNSCSSAAVNELYKSMLFERWTQILEKHQEQRQIPSLDDITLQELQELTRSAEYRQLTQLGYLKQAIQVAFGLFLAYFAACLIHRRKQPEPTHATDTSTSPPSP